ncbi:alpha/beta hydrolase [Streptomyces sp. CRN 30]|uniref:alpha/beta fold hydrolase n=1 Tax=Streptomyces sp. CRN 30 TaxID=3075613 RepID=UPI002A826327|nr:alpha/beta hydrolase [Streptomyces sp. CRN 30]
MTLDAAHSETHTFASHDGPLAYRDTGEGPPLVLLHSGFVDHRAWDAQIPVFARDHRVIAPDARGHGRSANASKPFRPTDDLAALLRHLDVGPAVLVGVSMGAGTAVDTALEHPDLVRALVVSGAGTHEPEYSHPWTLELNARWARAMAAGDVEGWLDAFALAVSGPHRALDDVDPDIVRKVREMAWGTISKHTAGETDWTVPVTDTWARAAGITVPVLAVNGALDAADLIGNAERLVATVAGESRTVTLPDTGHYPHMERPEAFNAVLLEWLASLDA